MRSILAFALLVASSMATLAQQDEAQVRSDCRYDALRYCARFIPAPVLLRRREPTQAERDALIGCMLAYRDKLQSKCSRHLY